jgi:CheY-like chemotaxis protein
MRVILVLEDDTVTRDALTETLRRLFPLARVIATPTDAASAAVEREGADVVLATLPVAERLCRETACLAVRMVALTHAMGPDTLMRAEALGVRASLRAPASAEHLRTVLGPMLDG